MKKTVLRFFALLLVSLSIGIGQSEAGVIYSNFGPGMTFDTNVLIDSWTINGFLGSGIGQQAVGCRFTPTSTATFTGAFVALTLDIGPGNVAVFLQADLNGLPGLVLEQINVSGLTTVPTVFAATSVVHPQLQGGTPYWLTVVAGGPGVLASWNWNSTGDNDTGSNFASTQGGSPSGPWFFNPIPGQPRGAFQVNGEAIPAISVSIDIKPGSSSNPINPKSRGTIPVAILSSSTFDAFASVDTASLTFGRTGNENSLAFCNGSPGDVNGDGLADLMCHFDTQRANFQAGDTQGLLKGKTLGGTALQGADSAHIVP